METPICPACGCSLVRIGTPKKKAVQHNHAGQQYWFCCKGCVELFITDSDSCLAETAGLTVCPVCLAEKPLNATVTMDFSGKTVGFCRCPHCRDVFNKDPHYFIAKGVMQKGSTIELWRKLFKYSFTKLRIFFRILIRKSRFFSKAGGEHLAKGVKFILVGVWLLGSVVPSGSGSNLKCRPRHLRRPRRHYWDGAE